MSRLQVLVATMRQSDFSLFRKMNLQSDAIFANQNGENSFAVEEIDGHRVTMISTDTVGVGVNRNIALLAADAEILLFADDDTVYYDGYAEAVLRAFDQQPDADLMVFGIDFTKNDAVYKRRSATEGRKRPWRALRYGAGVLAVKRTSLLRANVSFSVLFGGGCIYSSGEDSLFLVECLRRGLKLYGDPFVLGKSAKDASSWFEGYGRKFFYDKGAWIAAAFPKTKRLMKLWFFLRFRKLSELPQKTQLSLMKQGMRNYPKLVPYEEDVSLKSK